MDQIDAGRIARGEGFAFRCHAQLTCFNRCCHNLNLYIYPYDLLRLKNSLQITADLFIERYVDIILRRDAHFPEVLLRMADEPQKPCIFLCSQGCRIYDDRPHTCRLFPIEQGAYFNAALNRSTPVFYFRPPDFCQGPAQDLRHTIESYIKDQKAGIYDEMTTRWAEIRRLMQDNPWGAEGPQGTRAKMTFMAAYNPDRFREFVFQSSFLKRYHVPAKVVKKIRKSDTALLSFGFDWIKHFLWGLPSKQVRPR